MKTYIITYTFRNPWNNYSNFYNALKNKYRDYQHALEETWFIKTDDTALEINDTLKPYLKSNDTLFVVEITDNYAGWMPKSIWSWLKNRI